MAEDDKCTCGNKISYHYCRLPNFNLLFCHATGIDTFTPAAGGEGVRTGPCVSCGAINYPLSMGGPSICPSCDCGSPSPRQFRELRDQLTALRRENERLSGDLAEKSNELVDEIARGDAAESELCNICVICGSNDPSDGEGTRPDKVTEIVKSCVDTLTRRVADLEQLALQVSAKQGFGRGHHTRRINQNDHTRKC